MSTIGSTAAVVALARAARGRVALHERDDAIRGASP
jgi:hypothetical protein